jgi:hypothetical protein
MAPFAFPSDASVPFVAAIFPEAAMAAADRRNAIHRFDAHHIFRHLVTELALAATEARQTRRRPLVAVLFAMARCIATYL